MLEATTSSTWFFSKTASPDIWEEETEHATISGGAAVLEGTLVLFPLFSGWSWELGRSGFLCCGGGIPSGFKSCQIIQNHKYLFHSNPFVTAASSCYPPLSIIGPVTLLMRSFSDKTPIAHADPADGQPRHSPSGLLLFWEALAGAESLSQ